MPTYVIGDVQGCYDELMQLLTRINFDSAQDKLWFTGDVINRGPKSLEVLRFIKSLGSHQQIVLGNHDIHFLAVAYGVRKHHPADTLESIFAAPDKDELIDWLRQQPLFHYDEELGYVMTHAGIPPFWSLSQTKSLAAEVEEKLKSENPAPYLENFFGNEPNQWRDDLIGMDRLRCIVNYLTRMRFCHADGRLDLAYKGEILGKPEELTPWFNMPNKVQPTVNILFGHWAALRGKTNAPNVYALDTGCAWGECLTAMRLEDKKIFTIKC